MTISGATIRRERARLEMREAIIDSARKMVVEEGAANLSMRAIARELGYSPAALYEYFPSKEALSCALYFDGAEGLAGRMRNALAALPAGASASERMLATGNSYRNYAMEQPELYRLAFGGSFAWLTAETTQQDDQDKDAFAIIIEIARDGIASGEFEPMQPEEMAFACWAMSHGFVMLELAGFLEKGKHGHVSHHGTTAGDHLHERALRVLAEGFRRR